MDRSVMDRTANVSWSGILGTLHQSIRKAVFDAGRAGTGSSNAKADNVEIFDLAGLDGAPLAAPESLTDRVSLVAAPSRERCDEIVEVLGDGGH